MFSFFVYTLITGSCQITYPTVKLKKYVNSSKPISEQDKLALAKQVIGAEYNNYTHKDLGSFKGIKSISNIKFSTGTSNYQNSQLNAQVQLYFYKIYVKEIIDFVVNKVTSYGIQGIFNNYLIQVPIEHLSIHTPLFNPTLNIIQIAQKRIKQQDVIRTRITSLYNSNNLTLDMFKAKGTCRNTGAGKLGK